MGELWQKLRWPASILFVAICLWCLWLWQPERQVRLHHEHLIDAAEDRNWRNFGELIDPGYVDRWGHDKTFVIKETSEVMRQFFTVTIRRELIRLDASSGRATVTTRLKLEGNGTAIAQYAMQAVNGLETPFTFDWRQKSWRPWDWKLARADNPRLQMRGGFDF